MDIEKKCQRLTNILAGTHDAVPEALTMTNVEADDRRGGPYFKNDTGQLTPPFSEKIEWGRVGSIADFKSLQVISV